MKVITHNDRFHADDVFAMAMLRIVFGNTITEVVRTRDRAIIETGDIVFDVGHIYDEQKNRFDHHQTGGAGVRENGIPYAASGLVWKKWGTEICGSLEVALLIDKKIIQPIDAGDNGYSFYTYTQDNVEEYTLDTLCGAFGGTWKEEENYDTSFFELVDIAEKILKREIKVAQDKIEAIPLVEKAYENAEDKRIIILDEYYPWSSVLKKYESVLFVISPNREKTMWRVNAIQKELFKNKKDFPVAWGGLRDTELEKVSEVEGAIFCHKGLFMAAATTKQSAILLAKKAIEA